MFLPAVRRSFRFASPWFPVFALACGDDTSGVTTTFGTDGPLTATATDSVGTDTAATDTASTDSGATDSMGSNSAGSDVTTATTGSTTTEGTTGTGTDSGTTSTGTDGTTMTGTDATTAVTGTTTDTTGFGTDTTGGGSTGGGTGTDTTGSGSTGGGLCAPGETQCDGQGNVEICNANGDGWDPYVTCDGLLGLACNPVFGECDGPCAPKNLGTTYVGCDYYPTVTSNSVATKYNFAVAVANTTNQNATVTVTRGAMQISQVVVTANSLQVINLPWVEPLKGGELLNSSWPTVKAVDGAYRLRSTRPVTVYQYNPIEYKIGPSCSLVANSPTACSFTNDASLLLPTNTWGNEYMVAARNGLANQLPGFYAVIAKEDGTSVTLAPSATGASVAAGAGVPANGSAVVSLDEGDVIQVYSTFQESVDLTGTRVTATKPVQVIAGHRCIYIPNNTPYCDHIEESMFPIDALAKSYIVTTPLIRVGVNDVDSPNMVRVIAIENSTTISYDPPQGGAPTFISAAGGFFEIAATSANFEINADKKIQVVQYMRGRTATASSVGDPAMAIAVPTDQFRNNYLFHASVTYDYNYVNIVAPTGSTIVLDAANVAGWTAIGGTGYSFARVSLGNGGTGNHTVNGTSPFGISVYGYGVDTSYWYPGGSDLVLIPQ